jgi:hypothetical protein
MSGLNSVRVRSFTKKIIRDFLEHEAIMDTNEKRENYSLNPTRKTQRSAITHPDRDISKMDFHFEIPLALLDWLAKINQRLITQNNDS